MDGVDPIMPLDWKEECTDQTLLATLSKTVAVSLDIFDLIRTHT